MPIITLVIETMNDVNEDELRLIKETIKEDVLDHDSGAISDVNWTEDGQ